MLAARPRVRDVHLVRRPARRAHGLPQLGHLPQRGRVRPGAGSSRATTSARGALDALVEAVLPGRSLEIRRPNAPELALTTVVALTIEEASAKVSEGPTDDEPEDVATEVWAGDVPAALVYGDAGRRRPTARWPTATCRSPRASARCLRGELATPAPQRCTAGSSSSKRVVDRERDDRRQRRSSSSARPPRPSTSTPSPTT